jgi:hypothetical protein
METSIVLLERVSTLDNANKEHDDRDDQENVNKTSENMEAKKAK